MVDISTVDAYQGKEADIVIFSCVRAAESVVLVGLVWGGGGGVIVEKEVREGLTPQERGTHSYTHAYTHTY